MEGGSTEKIEVGMNEMRMAANGAILSTGGIGSCLVVTLYDPQTRTGAMAHAMLPTDVGQGGDEPLRFVDRAIDALIAAMEGAGVPRERLQAGVVGGADLLEGCGDEMESVGGGNIASALNRLKLSGIKVTVNITGGKAARAVDFHTQSGNLEVRSGE